MRALTIHESTTTDGVRETVEVSALDGALVVSIAGEATTLPMVVLERVMERYGKPLDESVSLAGPDAEHVDLGQGNALHRIRHRGFYDVIARDFVVLSRDGHEPLVELATSVSAALAHFVGAARRS